MIGWFWIWNKVVFNHIVIWHVIVCTHSVTQPEYIVVKLKFKQRTL